MWLIIVAIIKKAMPIAYAAFLRLLIMQLKFNQACKGSTPRCTSHAATASQSCRTAADDRSYMQRDYYVCCCNGCSTPLLFLVIFLTFRGSHVLLVFKDKPLLGAPRPHSSTLFFSFLRAFILQLAIFLSFTDALFFASFIVHRICGVKRTLFFLLNFHTNLFHNRRGT